MKKNQNSKTGPGFRTAPILATLLLAISLSASANPFDEKEPHFKAVVFQKQNALVFKAIAKDVDGAKIKIKIINYKDDVIYEETYKNKDTYNRNFDVSTLEPGSYKFEISNRKSTYIQRFEIGFDNKKQIIVK